MLCRFVAFPPVSGYRDKASRFAFTTEEFMAGTKVTVFSNGPLRVEGDFEIVDQEGKVFGLGGRTAITLCRCGHSANSPFCDGSHKRSGFTSTVAARDLPPPVPKL
jgi:CDGSH-type Zn-finger protein